MRKLTDLERLYLLDAWRIVHEKVPPKMDDMRLVRDVLNWDEFIPRNHEAQKILKRLDAE